MSIRFIEKTKQFILETNATVYQMKVDSLGYLNHLYYGLKVLQDDLSYPFRIYDHGFSGNPYDMRNDRAFSLDTMPQEYTSFGVRDFRISSIAASCSDGSRCAESVIKATKYLMESIPYPVCPLFTAERMLFIHLSSHFSTVQ